MLAYLSEKDEQICCGCRGCIQVCPMAALTMVENREGFFYPVLDQSKCVNCHLCEKVCPEMNPPAGQVPLATYAVQSKDKQALRRSSSGGVFRLLADHVIEAGGYVVGCVWDENSRPVLRMVHEKKELEAMQGSKYLSSSTEDVYSVVKRTLDTGATVLFSGAPCQCAGLLNYLRKPYDNLLTLDFLCHGMPPQKVFDAFIASLKERYGADIEHFEFRDKKLRGWGHVESYEVRGKRKYTVGMTSPYLYGFLKGYFNRYSCYSCKFRGQSRAADFTMADFWGVERHHRELESAEGVSAFTVNTAKAQKIVSALEDAAVFVPTQIQWIAEDNPALLHTREEPVPALRRTIFRELDRDGWKKVEKRHLRCPGRTAKKLWYAMPMPMQEGIKKLIKK